MLMLNKNNILQEYWKGNMIQERRVGCKCPYDKCRPRLTLSGDRGFKVPVSARVWEGMETKDARFLSSSAPQGEGGGGRSREAQ